MELAWAFSQLRNNVYVLLANNLTLHQQENQQQAGTL